MNSEKRQTLPPSRRLHGSRAFTSVFDAHLRKTVGPLTFCAKPNTLAHPRLGLSVSRRVGNAVVRNRIKRLLRDAFRLCQHDWPAGYDVIVVVKPHPPAALADYQRLLFSALRALHQESLRHQKRDHPPK